MRPTGIIETALYGGDVAALRRFYERVLGLNVIRSLGPQGVAMGCGSSVLLLFDPAATLAQEGEVPSHGARGAGHAAFAIRAGQQTAWREHLERHGIDIESEVDWPAGGHSIYFRDPAGNSLELTTPSIWGLPDS